jgi:multicomponent Na+:H+ antiporter subunit D
MEAVAARMAEVEPNAAIFIAVGYFIAFGVKLGLSPFHFWLPTVYAGTRPAVAAILSGALANIGVYGVLRFGAGLLAKELALGSTVLILIGCASIVYGAVLAVSRRSAAETLAYSAIGQAGYVLVAVGVGGPVGLAAAVLYAVVNAVNKTLLFLAAGVRGALVGAAFVVGAFSVAGVPPAAGFVGKLALFRTGIVADNPALIALLIVGGALSLVYMFQLYQHDFWLGKRAGVSSPLPLRLLSAALALVVLAAGLWPEPLLALSREAAAVFPEGRG